MGALHLSIRFSVGLSGCFTSETTEWILIKFYIALKYWMDLILPRTYITD
jgi:hypothetical protein